METDKISLNRSELAIEGMPGTCSQCSQPLCLRQQVINLTLGQSTQMGCLLCLAKESSLSREAFLLKLKSYIAGRSCFLKEWDKYENASFCPDPGGCCPIECFVN